jgi:hypothetical protein
VIDAKPRQRHRGRAHGLQGAADRRQFDRLLGEMAEFSRYVMTSMADRMRRMNDKKRSLRSRLSASPGGAIDGDRRPPRRSAAKWSIVMRRGRGHLLGTEAIQSHFVMNTMTDRMQYLSTCPNRSGHVVRKQMPIAFS